MIAKLAFYAKINKVKNKGFTLIEIMLVVLIISLVLSLIIINGVRLRAMANEAAAQANLKSIGTSLEVYAASHSGLYAQSNEPNMQFLVDARCISQDFINIGNVGNYHYVLGSIGPMGYDIRAMAVNKALACRNYQVVTGALLKRSDTSEPGDINFKNY